MSRIQQLPPLVVAQIAAGEVIERPASVVKELMENSLDAGATRLDVEVGQGGSEYIRVVDDGSGIEPDDLPLALAAHATSKLRCAEDLFRVGTLGFRGEGLASIAGVSQLTLQSRVPDSPQGAEVHCHGGQLSAVRVWNGAPGTRIEVRHLFFNTPVRRKFLKGPGTEMGHITEAFTRLALARLGLHLVLRHNGKVVHDVPASAGLLDRIALFFGEEVRRGLYLVEAEQGRLTLGGYVADPAFDKGGTQLQYLFVNGRWVRDRGVSGAILEAYQGLVMTGRHPVCFLFLELPADEVDVNVHPTKAEVRFRQAEKVQGLIVEAIRKRLQGEDLTAPLRVRQAVPRPAGPPQADLPFAAPVARPLPPLPDGRPALPPAPHKPEALARDNKPEALARGPALTPPPNPLPEAARGSKAVAPPAPRPVKAVQMHDLYLVIEVPEGILVIDQHALHERILFEQLRERHAAGQLEAQRLLIPEPVALPPAHAALVLEHKEALAELALEVSDFGRGTVLLASYPAVLGKRRPRDILQAVVEYLTGQERPPARETLLNDLLSLMACHAAVRAGDRLTPEEIAELAAQRHLARDAHHCPHGRPTSLLFSRADLDRQFRRT
jgi:DNA mismatch repair protein MutL